VLPAPAGGHGRFEIRPGSFVPNLFALAASTTALYELIGELARQTFETLHIRRHTP